MGNLAFLNASFLSQESLLPFAAGPSALERSIAFAAGLPGVTSLRIAGQGSGLLSADHPALRSAPLPLVLGREGPLSGEGLIEELEAGRGEAEHIFVLPADAPLLDPLLAERIWKLHREQAAEYSFADGYPFGLAPEILRASIIPILTLIAADMKAPGGRDLLFSVIQKDINGFDVETEISPVDLRQHRLSLSCDSRRNRLVAEALFAAGARDAESLGLIVPQRRELLRSLPAWLAVQVSGPCPQACSLCPYPLYRPDCLEAEDFMPLASFSSLMDQMEALAPDAVVSPSLWGECALHPEIAGIFRAILSKAGFRCVAETSGIGWKPGVLEEIAALPGAGRIDWILSLDGQSEATYRALRGEGRAEALAFAERLLSLFPGRVHVQAVRVAENEDELEGFAKAWKEKGAQVIVQKHDDFSGFLPKRKLTDLSPLARHECWHLKRDLSVLADGTVPLCREDLGRRGAAGNAFGPGGLSAAWDAIGKAFLDQVEGRYEGPCATCDEYYTYNF